MARFRYRAVDPAGTTRRGEREGESSHAVRAALESEGMNVEAVEELAEPAGSGRLNTPDTRSLALHLAGLAKSGLPMPSGLRALEAELPAGPLRRVVRELALRLEQGEPLDDVLQSLGKRFPGHLSGLLVAGARSGNLGTVLGEFVSYSQVGESMRRSLWLSLSYPIMLVSAFLAVIVFVSITIVQGFKAIFMDFGVDLPALTRYLIAFSDVIAKAGWALAWGPLAVVGGCALGARFFLDPASRRDLAGMIPLLGVMWKWLTLAEFSHYLALLLEVDMPLANAVPLAAEGTRDPALNRACSGVVQQLNAGQSLAEAFAWSRIFPAGLVKLIRWSESHRSLSETLHMAGGMFEARARAQASFVGTVFSVVAVIFVLWGTAYVVVALFWPLLQLISKLSG